MRQEQSPEHVKCAENENDLVVLDTPRLSASNRSSQLSKNSDGEAKRDPSGANDREEKSKAHHGPSSSLSRSGSLRETAAAVKVRSRPLSHEKGRDHGEDEWQGTELLKQASLVFAKDAVTENPSNCLSITNSKKNM